MSENGDFQQLVGTIRETHLQAARQGLQAVNTALTLRNWLIGHHILRYEQASQDRAAYGARLLETLAARLQQELDRSYSGRYLGLCRQLCAAYPAIRQSLVSEFAALPIAKSLISESAATALPIPDPAADDPDGRAVATRLLRQLSFTHLVELMKCADPGQRRFYELEALSGGWSVRELKRQIGSLYYERSGLSTDPQALGRLTQHDSQTQTPAQIIRDPYVFEFLGLQPTEVMREADLESALIDRLQAFLLELGHGFCFEARQKRLLIGGEHFFIDLVFYHRILKCHVLVELKADHFRHEHLGQLNTYVAWYREHMMSPGDQPPIGILLCTAKNDELVHYALAGLAESLFVSRYQVDLPRPEAMAAFLGRAMQELGND